MSTFNDHKSASFEQSGTHTVSTVTNNHYAVEKVTEGTPANPDGPEVTITGGTSVSGELNDDLTRATVSNPVEFTASTGDSYCIHTRPIKFKVDASTNPSTAPFFGTASIKQGSTIVDNVIEGESATAIAEPMGICAFRNWTGDISSHDEQTTISNVTNDISVTANFDCLTSVVNGPLKKVVEDASVSWVQYNGFVPKSKRCDFFKYDYDSTDTTAQQGSCTKQYLRMVSGYYEPVSQLTAKEYTVDYLFRCTDKENPSPYTFTTTPDTTNSMFFSDCDDYYGVNSITPGHDTATGGVTYSCNRDTSITHHIDHFSHEHNIYPEVYPQFIFINSGSVISACNDVFHWPTGVEGNVYLFELQTTENTITYDIGGWTNYPRYYDETCTYIQQDDIITMLNGGYVDDESPEFITFYHNSNGTIVSSVYQKVLVETVYVKQYNGTTVSNTEEFYDENDYNTVLNYDESDCATFNGWYTLDENGERHYEDGINMTLGSDKCCNRYHVDERSCSNDYYLYGQYDSSNGEIYRPAYLVDENANPQAWYTFCIDNVSLDVVEHGVNDSNDKYFLLPSNTTVYADGLLLMEPVNSGADYVVVSNTNEIRKASSSSTPGYKLVDSIVTSSTPIYLKKYWLKLVNEQETPEDFIIDSYNDPQITIGNTNDAYSVINSSPLYFLTNWDIDPQDPENFVTVNRNIYYDKLIYMSTCSVNKSVAFLTCKTVDNFAYNLSGSAEYQEYSKKYTPVNTTSQDPDYRYCELGDIVNINDGFELKIEFTNLGYEPDFYYNGTPYSSYHLGFNFPSVIHNNIQGTFIVHMYAKDVTPVYNSEHWVWDNTQWQTAENYSTGDTFTLIEWIPDNNGYYALAQKNGLYGYYKIPYISNVEELEYAVAEKNPFIFKIDGTIIKYQGETYSTVGLYGLDDITTPTPDATIYVPSEIPIAMAQDESVIYIDNSNELIREFYCDYLGCDRNGWYIGTSVATQDSSRSYYYIEQTGCYDRGVFYKYGYYYMLNHTDRYTEIANEIVDGITTVTDTLGGVSCYKLTAPVEINSITHLPEETDYRYKKINYGDIPSGATIESVGDETDLDSAVTNHYQYIKITGDFHITTGINRGVRYFTNEYYELEYNYYKNVTDGAQTKQLSFVGWLVEGTPTLSFYCDRNGQTEGGIVDYPVKNELVYNENGCGDYVTVTNRTYVYNGSQSAVSGVTYIDVYGVSDLAECMENGESFHVLSGYDIYYDGVTYIKNWYYVTNGEISLAQALQNRIPCIYCDFDEYYIEYDSKLFKDEGIYTSTFSDILIYDDLTLNRAYLNDDSDYFVIADYIGYVPPSSVNGYIETQSGEPEVTYTSVNNELDVESCIEHHYSFSVTSGSDIVYHNITYKAAYYYTYYKPISSLEDLKGAIANNDEYIQISWNGLYYNGLIYASGNYYKRCTMTIDGHTYNPGDVLVKKVEKKFYPKDVDVYAQKCETCTAIYAYEFTMEFCSDTTCLPQDWANGLAFFFDGVRMAWVYDGPLFDHTFFIDGHTLTPYIDIEADVSSGSDSACLAINGYNYNCSFDSIEYDKVICPPSQINDIRNWVYGKFKPCNILNLNVDCRNFCNINIPEAVDEGFEYEYIYNDSTSSYLKWNENIHSYESTQDDPSQDGIPYYTVYYWPTGSSTPPNPLLHRKYTRGLYKIRITETNSTGIVTVNDNSDCIDGLRTFIPIIAVGANNIVFYYKTLEAGRNYIVDYQLVHIDTDTIDDSEDVLGYILVYNNQSYMSSQLDDDGSSLINILGCNGANFVLVTRR